MTDYDAAFFQEQRTWASTSAQRLVPLFLSLANVRSAIDVGCGTGTWLAVLRRHGVEDVLGVDGPHVASHALDIPAESFLAHDLEQPLRVGRTFDLALALEVAEHLPASRAADFVQLLTSLSSMVLFSAAIPHQGGTAHLNEQWPEYWAALFAEHDYVPVDCLRRKVWSDPEVAWWYAQNALLYVDRRCLERQRKLKAEHDFAGTGQLSLVHPKRYLEWVEYAISESQARW